jgi:hypothetical protein
MRRVAVLLTVLVALAGCGTDTKDTAAQSSGSSTSPTGDSTSTKTKDVQPSKDKPSKDKTEQTIPADAPACAAVWDDGARLARDYEGCMFGKVFVAVDQEPCSFGQRLVRYGEHYYAVRGGPVNRTAAPLLKDRDYRSAVASCRA